jgi:hypothetical protein
MNWLAGPTQPIFPQNGVLRARTAPGWRYADPATILIFNHYGENLTTGGALRLPPFYFLAAVGNRP